MELKLKMPITKAQIKKLEKQADEWKDSQKDYQYIFSSKDELEKAEKEGRIKRGATVIVIDL